MQSYTARLEKRPGLFSAMMVDLPKSVTIQPEKWSASEIGGPKDAVMSASGTPDDLAYLLTWLGDRAFIHNEAGTAVWWGVIYEIEISLGNVIVTNSLTNVYNRVKVVYSFTLPDGSTESRRTTWASDESSILRYGQRDLLYSLPSSEEVSAELVRDRILAQFADPSPMIRTQANSTFSARLFCRGHWQLLDFVYWQKDEGLVAHDTSTKGVQELGASYTSTGISFGEPAGDQDYMKDVASNFGSITEGMVLNVKGAAEAANNGVVTVQAVHGTNIVEIIEDSFVDETAGATVSISLGRFGMSGWIAQSFSIGSGEGWTATRVSIRVQRIGSPSDNLVFSIWADGGGHPGTLLGSGSVAGTSVPTTLDWFEIELDTPVDLALATTYYVGVSRSSNTSITNYYVVGIDEDLGHSGSMVVYNGSNVVSGSWVTRDPDADLPFRVIGEVDSITQMVEAIERSPEYSLVLPKLESGIMVRSHRPNDRNLLDEVTDMLELGVDDGSRLTAYVDKDRNVIVQKKPATSDANPVLGGDGKIYYGNDVLFPPGELVAGRWITVAPLPVLDGLTKLKGTRDVYIVEAEYDPRRDQIILRSEGAIDPWTAWRLEKR